MSKAILEHINMTVTNPDKTAEIPIRLENPLEWGFHP